jgi:hypothetical protein
VTPFSFHIGATVVFHWTSYVRDLSVSIVMIESGLFPGYCGWQVEEWIWEQSHLRVIKVGHWQASTKVWEVNTCKGDLVDGATRVWQLHICGMCNRSKEHSGTSSVRDQGLNGSYHWNIQPREKNKKKRPVTLIPEVWRVGTYSQTDRA